ncbi:hypothetical protein J4573_29065 [Actinomadura barringtoniae]|uniref:Uncharacterized protein n=1 Tax=Actinomadura barringtoniae TaxID=1427535 RepID=A0A939T3H7_9ACTN|nr:hypothetical protein [Actinomadura barringtoniae]MBO2451176.1 hypothetical protein [Actinomadura barringtoniae]
MITALVLCSLAALLAMSLRRLLRPPARREPVAAGEDGDHLEPKTAEYPESMTAELDPGEEEYLAWLADDLWPEDEYLEPGFSDRDGEEEAGGSSVCR